MEVILTFYTASNMSEISKRIIFVGRREYVWQNRQIKNLIKRNGRHLNTSAALA